MNVDVLIATYNGEKYIARQLESVLEQSYTKFKIYICDDCSTDGTVKIISDYAAKYSDKISYIVNSKNSGSPRATFFKLINRSTADYIFTADQDDIWLKDKIKITLEAFNKEAFNKEVPILVHTDLTVIDEHENIINQSMIKAQGIDVTKTDLNYLLVQNVVTGCSMAFNKALLNILKEPSSLNVHDWWIATLASIYGEIRFIDKPTLLYRQHDNNVCGSKDMKDGQYLLSRFKDNKRAKDMLSLGYSMAGELMDKYDIPSKYKDMLIDYSDLRHKNKVSKLLTAFKYSIWKHGLVRKLGQIYFM